MGQLCTYTKKSRRSGSRQPVDRAPPDGFAVQIGLLSQEKCDRVHSLQSEKMHFASRSAVHPFARITFGLIPRSVDSNVGFYCFRRHHFTNDSRQDFYPAVRLERGTIDRRRATRYRIDDQAWIFLEILYHSYIYILNESLVDLSTLRENMYFLTSFFGDETVASSD